MDWEDVQPKKPAGAAIGENLENMSVAELEARIVELKAEIDRVTKERERKVKLGAAADQVFKT